MAALTITNTFSVGAGTEVIVSSEMDKNFQDIIDEVNALTDDNISTNAGIEESKLAFTDGEAGHDHGGSTEGSTLSGPAVALATGAVAGTVMICRSNGFITIPAGDSDRADIFFNVEYTQPPRVYLYWDNGSGGEGNSTEGINATNGGIYIEDLTANSFKIFKRVLGSVDVAWMAIGN